MNILYAYVPMVLCSCPYVSMHKHIVCLCHSVSKLMSICFYVRNNFYDPISILISMTVQIVNSKKIYDCANCEFKKLCTNPFYVHVHMFRCVHSHIFLCTLVTLCSMLMSICSRLKIVPMIMSVCFYDSATFEFKMF